jgi:hypothetical protein
VYDQSNVPSLRYRRGSPEADLFDAAGLGVSPPPRAAAGVAFINQRPSEHMQQQAWVPSPLSSPHHHHQLGATSAEPILLVPDRGSPGLFGPRSPRDSADPNFAPTPPSAEPILLVPDRGSPGLFGPRSPRDSYFR